MEDSLDLSRMVVLVGDSLVGKPSMVDMVLPLLIRAVRRRV